MLAHDIALNHFYKFGPVMLGHFKAQLGDAEAIWLAPKEALLHDEVPERLVDEFVNWRSTRDPHVLEAAIRASGISVVCINDATYPALLKTIYDPPHLLYYRGTLPSPDAPCLGVVGSRAASPYGLQVAHDLSHELAAHGIVIVSGLAQGIDEAAHTAALEAKGKTIAVLGHGFNAGDSTRKHRLGKRIVDEGSAVITEFPPTMPPLKQHFPIRNRIIAGISKGTLVVEAANASGTLITARAAMEEGREVFAVPGPITSPTSQGTNRLCKDGAHLVTEARDVLEIFGLQTTPTLSFESKGTEGLVGNEKQIADALTRQPQHIDEIVRRSGLPGPTVSAVLTSLEIQGFARNIGGMRYIR